MATHWVAITCFLIPFSIIICTSDSQSSINQQTYSASSYDSPATQTSSTGQENQKPYWWQQDSQSSLSEVTAQSQSLSSSARPRQRVVGCSGDGCSSPLFSAPASSAASSNRSPSSSVGGNYYWQKPGHPCSTHQGTDCPYDFKCVNYLTCSNGVISENGNWGYASQKPSIEELMSYGRPCGYSGKEVCCQDAPTKPQEPEVQQPLYYPPTSTTEKPIDGPIYYPPAPAFPTQRYPDATTEAPVYNPPSYRPPSQTFPEDYPQSPSYDLPPPGYAPVYTTTVKPSYYTTTKPAYKPSPPPVYTPIKPIYKRPTTTYHQPPTVYTPVYSTSKPTYKSVRPTYTPVYARPKPAYKSPPESQSAPAYGPPAYPGCAAALKCVPEEYCSIEGIIISKPIYLSYEQKQFRTPLMTCLDVETNENGFCCRDPYYNYS